MLEPLPDLSVETPLDVRRDRGRTQTGAAAAGPVLPGRGGAGKWDACFTDPDLQLDLRSRRAAGAASVPLVIPVPAAPRPRLEPLLR